MYRKINALLWFHFKIDPRALSNKEWADRWRELQFALSFESKRFSGKGDEAFEL